MLLRMHLACASVIMLFNIAAGSLPTRPELGYPVGYLSVCPGVLKNATITQNTAETLNVIVHHWTPARVMRRGIPINSAAKIITKDKNIDLKNKKTLLYCVGYLDSSVFSHSQAIANVYSKKGYNVLMAETFSFLNSIYPKSARLARPIGNMLGKLLADLTNFGLKADNLEMVAISLGSHVAGHAAKQFYAITGKKPARITAMDPAGPCFRFVPPEHRLDASDAEMVDVIHTNIDGFGIARRLGHVDFYVNGGEYQPNDIKFLPCLIVCSHVKSLLYFWQALENPKKFIAIKCDSVQDARTSNCYNNTETNYLGLETDFDKPGIYYLSTHYKFPYYKGNDGLKAENDNIHIIGEINSDDLVLK